VAVRIRLKRAGSRHRPFYKIIVTDSRSPRDGAAIESLGYYNPLTRPEEVRIDVERYDHWISMGASASEPVQSLLKKMKRRAAGEETPEERGKALLEEPIEEDESAGGAGEDAGRAGSGTEGESKPEGESDKR